MLKTPRYPVWLCSINSSHSVAFSTNRSLLSDWRTEHAFQLYYYNGQRSQTSTAQLTVGEGPLASSQNPLLSTRCLSQCPCACRYPLSPLGGIIRRYRPREKVPFTGDDHQDQVGRSKGGLEQRGTVLLNTCSFTLSHRQQQNWTRFWRQSSVNPKQQ